MLKSLVFKKTDLKEFFENIFIVKFCKAKFIKLLPNKEELRWVGIFSEYDFWNEMLH